MSKRAKKIVSMATTLAVGGSMLINTVPVNAATLTPNTDEIVEEAGSPYYEVIGTELSSVRSVDNAKNIYAKVYKKTDSEGNRYAQITSIGAEDANGNATIPSTVSIFGTTYKVLDLAEGALDKNVTSLTISEGINVIDKGFAKDCNNLEKLVIGPDVEQITEDAFYGCSALQNVTFKGSKILLGKNCFASSGLKNIEIPAKATLSDGTFRDCKSLSWIEIPNYVSKIPDNCFSGCTGLSSIYLPASVNEIGNNAFQGSGLSYTEDSKGNAQQIDVNGTNVKSVIIPEGVKKIGSFAFGNCKAIKAISIPKSIESLGMGSFQNSGIVKAVMQNDSKYESLGDSTFQGTNLTNVVIPNNVKILGSSAFEDCLSLNSVTLQEGLTKIEGAVFKNCSLLKELTIPSTVEQIGYRYLDGCNDMTIAFNSLPYIKYNYHGVDCKDAYSYDGIIKKAIVTDKVTEIPERYFENATSLNELVLSEGLTGISENALANTGLTTVELPSTVTTIGKGAFKATLNSEGVSNSKLESVTQIKGKDEKYSLTNIKANAFQNCINLSKFDFTSQIEEIGDNSFENTTLESVTLPSNLSAVGNGAFKKNSKLKKVVVSPKVVSIGDNAFSECPVLSDLTLTEGLKSIGTKAFYNDAALETIKVLNNDVVEQGLLKPKTVTAIGTEAFSNTKLKHYFADNFEYEIIPKVDENGKEVPYSEGEAKNINIISYYGEDTSVDMNERLKVYNIKNIDEGAFSNNNTITNLILPESIETIGKGIFLNCGVLESVTIPSSIRELPENCFNGCKTLKNIEFKTKDVPISELSKEDYDKYVKLDINDKPTVETVKMGLRSINSNAFVGCEKLEKINFPETLEVINSNAVTNCQRLHELNFYEGLKSIKENAFTDCPILGYGSIDLELEGNVRKPITIPESVTEMGNNAFPKDTILYCKNYQYYLTDNGINIKQYTGAETDVKVPSIINGIKVENILGNAFMENNSIKSVTLEEGIKGIEQHAFYNCKNLSDVKIPKTMQKIDDYAFGGCDNLKSVELPTSTKGISSSAFKNSAIASIVSGNYTYVMKFDGSDKFQGIEIVEHNKNQDSSVKLTGELNGFNIIGIGVNAFANDDTLEEVTLMGHIQYVGNKAFANCSKLKTFNNEANATIAEDAFEGTSITTYYDNGIEYKIINNSEIAITKYNGDLETLVIPSQYKGIPVTSISDNAFNGCSKLASVTIPEGVKSIGANTFTGCTNLAQVIIPYTVEKIGANAFSGCTSLQTINLQNKITTIAEGTFKGCSSLKTIVIPTSVTTIGENAFNGCTLIDNTIDIPSSVKVIGAGAFGGTAITVVNLKVTSNEISLVNAFNEGTIIKYKDAVINHTVTFKDFDGRVINTQVVTNGGNATVPTNPRREGYIFKGWDVATTNITSDLVITAVYVKAGESGQQGEKVTVVFKDGDTIISTQEVTVGGNAKDPSVLAPTKEGYVFKGWDKATTNITANTEINAVYEVAKYTVTFKNYDGTTLGTQVVEHGKNATAPSIPNRDGYVFTGWDKAIDGIKGDVTVTAQYTKSTTPTGDSRTVGLFSLISSISLAGVFFKKIKKNK